MIMAQDTQVMTQIMMMKVLTHKPKIQQLWNFFPCKLILYSRTHFRGDSLEIEKDTDSLASQNFDDKLASVDVEGNCCWEIFVDENFSGQSMKFQRQGRFPSAVDLRHIFQKASSVKEC